MRNSPGLQWFAVRVKSNYEKPVSAVLRGKGFDEFLPIYRSKRQWSDRVKVMDLPLFPGYLFCRLDLNKRLPLLTTPGFLYLVGKGKTPEPVEEQEIMAIQSVVRSGLPALPWPSVVVGQKVRVERGPLRGVEGVVARIADAASNLCKRDAPASIRFCKSRSRLDSQCGWPQLHPRRLNTLFRRLLYFTSAVGPAPRARTGNWKTWW